MYEVLLKGARLSTFLTHSYTRGSIVDTGELCGRTFSLFINIKAQHGLPDLCRRGGGVRREKKLFTVKWGGWDWFTRDISVAVQHHYLHAIDLSEASRQAAASRIYGLPRYKWSHFKCIVFSRPESLSCINGWPCSFLSSWCPKERLPSRRRQTLIFLASWIYTYIPIIPCNYIIG